MSVAAVRTETRPVGRSVSHDLGLASQFSITAARTAVIGYFAAQGLQGLRLAAQGFFAAHGLQGFALAAQGFLAAHGLHGRHADFVAPHGLQGLHAAICTTSDAAYDCAAGSAVMPATAATAPIAAIDCLKLGTVVRFIIVSVVWAGREWPLPGQRTWRCDMMDG